jgi:hypothetical protein
MIVLNIIAIWTLIIMFYIFGGLFGLCWYIMGAESDTSFQQKNTNIKKKK